MAGNYPGFDCDSFNLTLALIPSHLEELCDP